MKSKTRKITAIVAALCVAASVSATAVVSAASNEEAIEPRASRVPYNFTINNTKTADNGRSTKTVSGNASVVPSTNDAKTQSSNSAKVDFIVYAGQGGAELGHTLSDDTRNFSISYGRNVPALNSTVGLKARISGQTGNDIHATGVWTP